MKMRMNTLKLCVAGLLLCAFLTGCAGALLEVENFIEYEKSGTVELPGGVSTIIYFEKTHDAYTEAGKPGDESYLIVKHLADETETVILQGSLGFEIRHCVVDEEKQRLYYTLRDWRKEISALHLVTYDLAAMREIKRALLFRESPGDALLIGMALDEADPGKIRLEIYENGGPPGFHGQWKYLSYDLETEETEVLARGISDTEHYAAQKEPSAAKDFFDVPYYDGPRDFHNAYYKPEYAGIYINDGTHNIRISKNCIETGRVFWLEDGAYVVSGSYLYDASGKMLERKIADGEVLAIY
ncbi:MAG: hypothetical protein FWC27_04205 [Firmicutes bacterium]|nr:hypothetical protein [Bacillota bacterium]